MDTNPYLKLSTLTTFGLHSRGRCLIHRFDYGYHPFFYPKFPQGPPQNLPGHSVKRLFQIHKRQPQFLLLFQKPLLHLLNNKYRICGTFTSAESKLHVINTHSPSQPGFNHSLKNFHNLVQQLYSPVGTTLQSISLSLIDRHQPALCPISWNPPFLYYRTAQVSHPGHTSLSSRQQHFRSNTRRPYCFSHLHFTNRYSYLTLRDFFSRTTNCVSMLQTISIPVKFLIQQLLKILPSHFLYTFLVYHNVTNSIFNTA